MQPEILIIAGLAASVSGGAIYYARTQAKKARHLKVLFDAANATSDRNRAGVERLTKERDQALSASKDLSRSLQATEANYGALERSNRTLQGNFTKAQGTIKDLKAELASIKGAAAKSSSKAPAKKPAKRKLKNSAKA